MKAHKAGELHAFSMDYMTDLRAIGRGGIGSEQGPVKSSCGHGNNSWDSITGKFLTRRTTGGLSRMKIRVNGVHNLSS
jgi:hypothetical protein